MVDFGLGLGLDCVDDNDINTVAIWTRFVGRVSSDVLRSWLICIIDFTAVQSGSNYHFADQVSPIHVS